ncbi:NAD(P)-binding domain-containing protein [Haloarcula sp. S1AR25-5A]|uniref:NAD(P)-binding domain-containing protein n=1 Tax=Haloarcula terrestris TaxID=2950533 RepID=A0AAE4F0T3_9EURY|nr:phosphogluconate dehydrogenase C-terminal domain-containing protein [Haloarcula terrestris]MDS0223557.1 NAD(P)-binding domain-containing protein [Haloarcula terrestris]
MTVSVALFGAGGKMGCRITDQLKDYDRYDVRYVEPSDSGRERLAERGLSATPENEALDGADIVVLAVPDDLIGTVSEDVVPQMDSESMVVLLDPAAAYAGKLYEREDISYFITHPAHPSIVDANSSLSGDNPDWFGGQGREQQDVVCALHQGPKEDYDRGEAFARDIYAPVRRAHELTTEQMVVLEPALVEMVLGSCLYAIREAYEHAVDMGVPEQAAKDFLFGHFRVELGIVFGFTDFPFSDGAQEAIEQTKQDIFVSDWKETVFSEERLDEVTSEIA